MKHILTLTTCLVFCMPAMADSKAFRSILGDAANIEKDAAAISSDLKTRKFDVNKVKPEIESLGNDIAALRKDVDALDGNLSGLSAAQKKDWELVKTKAQLITILYDQKANLLSGDIAKNRSLIRALATGIAQRAQLLQQTINRLDR